MRGEVGNVAHQVNTASKFSMVTSICLIILGVIILVLLGVGVAMIVKIKSNASDEDNGQGAVGGEANPECTPTTESTEGFPAMMVSGGAGGAGGEVEVISPTGHVSCSVPDLPKRRYGHTMNNNCLWRICYTWCNIYLNIIHYITNIEHKKK